MKERIVVKNFSVIDSIEMDVKPFTILIGPQSSGKSLMAKLVYFFKFLPVLLADAADKYYDKRQLFGMLRKEFNKIFPEYLLKARVFNITYFYGDKEVSITSKGSKSYRSYKFSLSTSILSQFKTQKDFKEKNLKPFPQKYEEYPYLGEAFSKMSKFLYGGSSFFPIFIPAGRSYFANVKERIFSMISQNVSIDYMLQLFGGFWETFKLDYASLSNESYGASAINFFSKILGGKYKCDKHNEWIEMTDNRVILLKDSSSGQQEAIPLLVPLIVMGKRISLSYYTFVEEPEAHLFPESQGLIVHFLALLYNAKKKKSGFFITTHSPYILSFFNNLIQGENAFNEVNVLFENGEIDAEAKDKRLKILEKLVISETRIDFDDVAVYEVKEGTCKDIKNYEYNLIDATVIDEVSNKTARTFDGLLDIAYGE